jgi:hypothetical protein
VFNATFSYIVVEETTDLTPAGLIHGVAYLLYLNEKSFVPVGLMHYTLM